MGEIGGDLRKVLAFGHLEIKQQKKIEEIRRNLPNLGEFGKKRTFWRCHVILVTELDRWDLFIPFEGLGLFYRSGPKNPLVSL